MKKILIFIFAIFYFDSAQALIELRINYGMNFVSPSALNDRYILPSSLSNGSLTHTQMLGPGMDVIVNLPAFPVGFGLRYENLSRSIKATGLAGNQQSEINNSRFAAVATYRLLDQGMFLGAIGTAGIYHVSQFKFGQTSNVLTYQADSTVSFTIAGEGGVKLGKFLLGGELGYMYYSAINYRLNGFQLTSPSDFRTVDVDLSGVYLKALVGYEF